ncbi:MAG: transposase, partial [Alphaproteobacteria bacterium]|nr:transposase [Alphaproteobacteria bacterium]
MLAIRRVGEGWAQKDVAAFLGVHPVTVEKWVARQWTEGQTHARSAPVPDRRAGAEGARLADRVADRPRVRHRSVDRPPGGGADPQDVRRAVPPELPAGVAGHAQLHPAEAGPAGAAAGPGSHRPLGRRGRAEDSKKAAGDHAHIVLIDESGLFINPLVRRSWSVRGHAPVIGGDGGRRRKVSVIGAITVSPRTRRLGLRWSTRADGYFGAAEVVGFLRCVLGAVPGQVVVVWDGGTNHKGPVMRAFRKRNRRVWPERLPPYAPELNPVEQVWGGLKFGQLANFVPDDRTPLDREIHNRLKRLSANRRLLRAL